MGNSASCHCCRLDDASEPNTTFSPGRLVPPPFFMEPLAEQVEVEQGSQLPLRLGAAIVSENSVVDNGNREIKTLADRIAEIDQRYKALLQKREGMLQFSFF